MKLFISTDFEGVAGIVDWDQIMVGSHDYEMGRRLLLGELNAAIDGAIEAGATEIVVNDSHSSMRNLPPDLIHGRARLLTGKHKPLYMMEGLDDSFDAIFFLGYHGSIGASQSILSHSYNPRAIWEARINGEIVGESGINALVAANYGVPIIFVSGDEVTAHEAEMIAPRAEKVIVKQSLGRFAASHIHPSVACRLLREGASRAVQDIQNMRPPAFERPVSLEVTFQVADMAEMSCRVRGVERVAPRSIAIREASLLDLYRSFVAVILLTRALVDTH